MTATLDILADEHLPTLVNFASSNVLLAFDYDGTLAPIAATPARARMRSETRRLLAATAALYPCVVISGRGLNDIARRLRGVPIWHVFGNHGLESGTGLTPATAQTRAWIRTLSAALDNQAGVVIEDKGLSITIHYRNAGDKPAAIGAIQAAITGIAGARIIGGKEAVNLLPFGGADKGIALRDALRLFACQTAIYVGDDATDEDAFAANPHQVLSIRVGTGTATRARYHLESQLAIDGLLEHLVRRRTPA